jgi:hypothetical protein
MTGVSTGTVAAVRADKMDAIHFQYAATRFFA